MGRNRKDNARYRILADKYGLSEPEVRKIVSSFFDSIIFYARGLPFNTPRKIYSKDKFEEFVKVSYIPYIGRIGPVYSNYLKWRANESSLIEMASRDSYRSRVLQSDIENTAASILFGTVPAPLKKRKGKEMFERVWLVGQDGKKSARQVIPKEK